MDGFTSPSEPSKAAAIDLIGGLHVHEAAGDGVEYGRGALPAAAVRRVIEVIVALAALIILLPLHLVVAIAIKRDSDGPIIFRQERLARGRRKFVLLKYRTMHTGADIEPHRAYVRALINGQPNMQQGSLYKLTIDPRITRVGRRLRQWSLDEVPQLINVVRGDMALVGPRPVIPYEAELYPSPYLRRFAVKPGMTGLWQVSGRNACTYDEMVRLDVEYVERRSLWLDLKILIKTIPVVLRREGAA
jgi:lipopolysaccharide/colanic/teichoic acid biosynthesis glycosyltransferase